MDVLVDRIPNVILFTLLIIQIVSELFSYITSGNETGIEEPLMRYLTVFIVSVFLFVFFSIGSLGAGDVKLVAIIAIGLDDPLLYAIMVFALAAVMSLALMLRRHMLIERLRYLVNYITKVATAGKLVPYYEAEPSATEKRNHSLHLSVPTFIAYCFFVVLEFRLYGGNVYWGL